MTSQDLFRSFDSEGPRAHYEWAMSVWSPADPLHVPAIQSNFGDLTSLNVPWPFDDWSCCIVLKYLASSHRFSPHHSRYPVDGSIWFKFYLSSV